MSRRPVRAPLPPLAARVASGIAVLAAAALLAGCGTDAPATGTSDTAGARLAASSTTTATPAPVDHTVEKALVVVVENHSLSQMREGLPWLFRLAQRYGYATDYRGVTHPSLPNYLAIAGGSTFGVADDESPSVHPISGPSVLGRAIAAGGTARLYADAMPGTCTVVPASPYAVKHNPWAYFTDERADCRRDDVPLGQLAGDVSAGQLPTVGMVIPDLCHDAHDCSLAVANRWLRRTLTPVLDGPDFTAGRLALVVTADEDDTAHGNRVLTVVAHPSISHQVVSTRLSHYGLSRSLAGVAGVRPLRSARTARGVLAQFGLTPGS